MSPSFISSLVFLLAFGKPRIDIQRHSKTMKHSPKKLEIFGETCTSLEIFSEISRREEEIVWKLVRLVKQNDDKGAIHALFD